MKNKLWNLFIVVLLALLAWTFYIYWDGASTVVEQRSESSVNSGINENKEVLASEEDNKDEMDEYNKKYSEMLKRVASKDRRGELEKEEEKMMQDLNETTFLTEEEVVAKTEEVYEELTPDSFESDVEEMDIALEDLDEKADAMDEVLMAEEEVMGITNMEFSEESSDEESSVVESENMELLVENDTLPEISDENEASDEDINNL